MNVFRCAALFCALSAATLAAQSPPPPCGGDDCAALREQVAAAAAAIDRDKNLFVAAVRQLIQAVPGTFGDEAPVLTASVDDMSRALARWDQSLRTYRTVLLDGAAQLPDPHVALAGAYLERGNARDGLNEALAAANIDPGRTDAYLLQAVAHAMAKRPADAARAFARAVALGPANAAAGYGLAQQLIASGDETAATAALHKFDLSQQTAAQAGGARAAAPAAPFVRAGLLRQPAGVAALFPPALYARGFALLANSAFDEAVTEFRKAVSRDPLAAPDVRQDGDVQQGAAALRRADLRTAIARFSSAAARSPDSAEPKRLLGAACASDEQYARGIEALSAAVARAPADDRARTMLADVLRRAQRPADAEHVLRDALDAIPASGGAHYQLASLYESLGRSRDAIVELERAAAAPPVIGQDHLYDTLGALHTGDANLDGALAAYRARASINPNSSDAHRKLGQIYLEQSRPQDASAEFTAALLLDPANADAHAGRAQMSLRLGEYADAERSARRALALNDTHMAAQYALGASLLRLGRADEGAAALEEYRRLQAAAQTAADDEWALRLVKQAAQSQIIDGDFNGAAALLRDAIARQPRVASNYISLGLVLVRAGMHAAAVDAFRTALALNPDADVHGDLAAAYAALGRLAESQAEQAAHDRAKERRLRTQGPGR